MAPPPKSSRVVQPDSTVAVLLTWFVPGAGHLYLGRLTTALTAFLVIEGLYVLGVLLSGGAFLEYLPQEMRGALAPALTPEVGNLGALLYQVREYGYGSGQPRPWPATMDLGTALTSTSGLLNLVLMSRAHIDAARPRRGRRGVVDPPLAALATWLIPGLGQALQGRRARGAVIFVLLVGLFLLGCSLAQGSNLDRERHFYYWAGQFLLGVPALIAEFVHGHPRITHDIPYADAGVVLGCVAGMLNVLVMLEAYAFGEHLLSRPPKAAGAVGPEASEVEVPA